MPGNRTVPLVLTTLLLLAACDTRPAENATSSAPTGSSTDLDTKPARSAETRESAEDVSPGKLEKPERAWRFDYEIEPDDSPAVRSMKRTLATQKGHFEFRRQPLIAIVHELRNRSGLNITFDPEIDSEAIVVTMEPQLITLGEVMDLLMRDTGLVSVFTRDMLYITTPQRSESKQ